MKYKKLRLIPLIVLFMIFILTVKVKATNANIILDGNTTVQAGKTYKLNVTLSSDENIGVLSGKINKSSNIKSISAVGKNSWNLTYNEKTGAFNIYKAEGSKNENIMELTYTVGNEASGEGNISIENSKVTTISYETIDKGTITKKLSISNNTGSDENKTDDNSGEDTDKDNKNNNGGNKKNNNNKSSQQAKITNKKSKNDITVANKIMPKTGKECIINILIVIIIIVAIILYKKNNEYKGV